MHVIPQRDGLIAIVKGPQMTSHVTYRKAAFLAKESTLTIRETPKVEKEKIRPINTTKLVNIGEEPSVNGPK